MSSPRFLGEDDLRQLTGRQRPAAQRRALTRMGIPHHVRPDGRPVVTAAALERRDTPAPKIPNWTALIRP